MEADKLTGLEGFTAVIVSIGIGLAGLMGWSVRVGKPSAIARIKASTPNVPTTRTTHFRVRGVVAEMGCPVAGCIGLGSGLRSRAGCGVGNTGTLAAVSTGICCASTMVMLSCPPCSLACRISSVSCASSEMGWVITLVMAARVSISVRPSLQSRRVSPGPKSLSPNAVHYRPYLAQNFVAAGVAHGFALGELVGIFPNTHQRMVVG